jgi:hypothetical protein
MTAARSIGSSHIGLPFPITVLLRLQLSTQGASR